MDLVRHRLHVRLRLRDRLIVYQLGLLFTGGVQIVGLIVAVALLAFLIYMLFRPYKEATRLTSAVPSKA